MTNNYKLGLGAFVLAAVALTGAQVQAYQGDYSKEGPNSSPERHQIMTQEFENGDYNAWKEQMGDRGRVTEVITEENFAQFAQAHLLGEAGDKAGADALRAELGLRTHGGERGGHGAGDHDGERKGNGEGCGEHKGERKGERKGGNQS